jgi:CheY-like chemotaxis protein/HPt (histidine-containing phosphotransfer) domain-containing protein
VLLVEDNDINQMVAVGILTGLGYQADVAGDGQVALEMAARRGYDAILMDCRMPRMDGFTATAELRRRESLGAKPTPIIAMTASALVADRERCLAAGMDDYLAKPVNPAELAAALRRWIGADLGAVADSPGPGRAALPRFALGSGWVQRDPGELTPARLGPSVPPAPAGLAGDDPVGRRLDELAGDHTEPERALVRRLVTSFLARAPQHAGAIGDALAAGDAQVVEDQAHSLRGAAGNIGATAVMRVCERIEDTARAGRLPPPGDLAELLHELDLVEHRLRELATV